MHDHWDLWSNCGLSALIEKVSQKYSIYHSETADILSKVSTFFKSFFGQLTESKLFGQVWSIPLLLQDKQSR